MNNKPPLKKWELWALIMWIVIGAFLWIAESDAQGHVTAIDCGAGFVEFETDAPAIVATFRLLHNRYWYLPANTAHKDGLTKPVYTLRFDDGSEMLVTLSGYLASKPNSVSKGLLWYGEQPDWRNVGDGHPHPNEMYLLDANDVTRIYEFCDE